MRQSPIGATCCSRVGNNSTSNIPDTPLSCACVHVHVRGPSHDCAVHAYAPDTPPPPHQRSGSGHTSSRNASPQSSPSSCPAGSGPLPHQEPKKS